MDEYGIGSAAMMAIELYDRSSRRSGRTTAMLDRARNEDIIICRRQEEAKRLRVLLKELGKTTSVHVVEHSDELGRVPQRAKGRCIFDHDWVRQFFVEAVKIAENDMQRMADNLSSVPPDRNVEKVHKMNIQRRGDFSL